MVLVSSGHTIREAYLMNQLDNWV